MKPQVEIFQLNIDNLQCGWCQAYLSSNNWTGHANQHLLRLEEMRDLARLTITVQLPEEEDDTYSVEDL